jgi:hypothetical protein
MPIDIGQGNYLANLEDSILAAFINSMEIAQGDDRGNLRMGINIRGRYIRNSWIYGYEKKESNCLKPNDTKVKKYIKGASAPFFVSGSSEINQL